MTNPLVVNRNLVILGSGTVGSCFLSILPREFVFDKVTVLAKDQPAAGVIPAGVEFVSINLTAQNYESVLEQYLEAGSICLNLAVLESAAVLCWCQAHDVLYLDTSGEAWEDEEEDPANPPVGDGDRMNVDGLTLHSIQKGLAKSVEEVKSNHPEKETWPTAVVYHGMNPGMVNQCMKRGLLDIAAAVLKLPDARNREAIQQAAQTHDFAALSQALGIETLHIAERDTQTSARPRQPGEFASTWSVDGFLVELRQYSEFALGTAERTIPRMAVVRDEGESVSLGTKGATTRLYSWVPSGPTLGFLTPHDEALTMGKYLSIRDSETGKLVYRPTVCFSYMPCDMSVCSIHEFVMRGYDGSMKPVFLDGKDITSGKDEVGILFLGHQLGSWWTGSRMSIEDAQKNVPGHGPTTIQVCAGVVSGLHWMLQHPTRGICAPEDMDDHEFVLAKAMPYLEPFVSVPGNFEPLQNLTTLRSYDYEDTFGPISDHANKTWMPPVDQKWQLSVLLQGAKQLKPSPIYVAAEKTYGANGEPKAFDGKNKTKKHTPKDRVVSDCEENLMNQS